jgi:hypothetical protein
MGATTSKEILTLDPNIRDWVVLPMFFIMVFVNLVSRKGDALSPRVSCVSPSTHRP